MDCKAYLRFENVGQGLFYTGLVTLGTRSTFSFVYDCGSVSERKYLQESIESYRRILKGTLDLLIVSHFDEDHVNGIVDLIRGIHVRKLVLPYISWIERLTIYLTTISKDDNYISLLTDPVTFFNREEFNIDEIIVIGGPDERAAIDNEIRPIPISPLSNEIGSEVEIMALGNKRYISPGDPFYSNFTSSSRQKAELSFYKTPFAFSISGFWEFQFYLLEMLDKAKMDAFQLSVETYLRKEGISWQELFDQKHRESLREQYRKYYNNLNQTSLITYHAPTKDISVSRLVDRGNLIPLVLRWHTFLKNKKGTLLTGDFKMRQNTLLNEIRNYYLGYWHLIGPFLVPHHGAKANWNFNHPNELEDFEIYVISSGLGRRHHPSLLVLDDIDINCRGELSLCNEINGFSYSFDFTL